MKDTPTRGRQPGSLPSGWIIALVIVVVLAFVIVGVKAAYPRKRILITFTTNGVAHVYGIPLKNGTVRRAVFSVIKVLKPKEAEVSMAIPVGRGFPELTNMQAISADLRRTGLAPPPSPPPPNPYE